jgi:hypothetical protein
MRPDLQAFRAKFLGARSAAAASAALSGLQAPASIHDGHSSHTGTTQPEAATCAPVQHLHTRPNQLTAGKCLQAHASTNTSTATQETCHSTCANTSTSIGPGFNTRLRG